jgi:hypothetical protein
MLTHLVAVNFYLHSVSSSHRHHPFVTFLNNEIKPAQGHQFPERMEAVHVMRIALKNWVPSFADQSRLLVECQSSRYETLISRAHNSTHYYELHVIQSDLPFYEHC